jgi:hypothetical protein
MVSSLLMRCAVVFLLIGLVMGIAMGMSHSFSLAPAHAHLNLTGFVLPFIAGLYYRAVPEADGGLLAKIQATLAIVGAIIFPAGLAAMTEIGAQYEPVVAAGSFCVLLSIALFAWLVFRTSVRASESGRSREPSGQGTWTRA